MAGKTAVENTPRETPSFYLEDYSDVALQYAGNPLGRGRMNDPSGAAWIKGLCGDTMEFYLVIKEGRITDIRFHTDGCKGTLACGSAATFLARDKTIEEVLGLSPADIIRHLKGLPRDHIHCSILAVSTLHKAVADYLLKY